jgi:hypothetical protein
MAKRISVIQRFPTIKQITPVYALTLFIFSSWTLLHFFWEFPSWSFFLNMREILAVLAYSLSVNLLESVIVTSGLVVLAAILPGKWFRDVFISVGAAFVTLILGFLMYFLYQFQSRGDYPSEAIKAIPFLFAGIIFLAFLLGHWAFTRKILEIVSDRAIVFLYLFVPLGIISIILVVLQNLF